MSRPFLLGLAFLLAASTGSGAVAETCSSSTLASGDFAVARWCGDPPAPGTLRMVRRAGRAEEFLNVPLDTYREVVRTPHVAQYVTEEIAPRFERGVAALEPRPTPARQAPVTGEGIEARPSRVRRVAARPAAAGELERPEAGTPAAATHHLRRHRHRRPAEEEQAGTEPPATRTQEARRTAARRARHTAQRMEERDR